MDYLKVAQKATSRFYWFSDQPAILSIAAEAAWKAEQGYTPGPQPVETFALYYAYNKIVDYLRSYLGREKRKNIPFPVGDFDTLDLTVPNLTVTDHYADPDLRRAVRTLPARERAMVYKYYVEGFSLAELGMEYTLSESRVSQILKSARKRIRSEYGVAYAG